MARAHPTSTSESNRGMLSITFSPALLHATWITAVVAVCVALCTIHSRKRSSFSSRRRGSSSRSCASSRGSINGDGGGTPAAKVSPTPSDTPKANNGGAAETPRTAGTDDGGGGGTVNVIDVGTHGPLAPVFLAPDPKPPRRSLSVKHMRFAERLGRIRPPMRRGSGEAAEDDVFVGLRGGDAADDDSTVLWTKTIILGERCRVPSGCEGEADEGDGHAMVRWKSYWPRQPRSVPVTRSNSFAGVGACKCADARY